MYYRTKDLAHFGIKNMKWGQRRYQNTDGSLTPAGKIRYGHPKAQQIKRYGAIARKRDLYRMARAEGPTKNTVRVYRKTPMYEQMAREAGRGLTAAEKAAGIARSAGRRKYLGAAGAWIAKNNLRANAVGSAAAFAMASAMGVPIAPLIGASVASTALWSTVGGAAIDNMVKNASIERMYRNYARKNVGNKQKDLPEDLEGYSMATGEKKRNIWNKYRKR